MIRFPDSWIQHFGVELVTATAPELGARFRYYERIRPQRPLSWVVRNVLDSDPSFVPREVAPMRRLVTREGEYGASTEITGRRRDRPVSRLLYATFMDDFVTVLDVLVDVPSSLSEVRLRADRLFASQRFSRSGRPRPFYFRPLENWQGIASGAAVSYYPPDFPRDLTTIAVPHAVIPAEGIEAGRELLLSSAGDGLEVESEHRASMRTDTDMAGVLLSLEGLRASRRLRRELAVFSAADRLYWMRLETARTAGLPELSAAFASMARSIHPLPSAGESRSGLAFFETGSGFDHWAT